MSVDAHRREVQVHAQREREESAQYDPEAIVERSGPFVRPSIYDYRMSGLYGVAMPTTQPNNIGSMR